MRSHIGKLNGMISSVAIQSSGGKVGFAVLGVLQRIEYGVSETKWLVDVLMNISIDGQSTDTFPDQSEQHVINIGIDWNLITTTRSLKS